MIGAPLFIISHPALVIAQCKAGVVGSFPALNARPQSQLDEWIHQITDALAAWDRANPDNPAAPDALHHNVPRSTAPPRGDLPRAEGGPGRGKRWSGSRARRPPGQREPHLPGLRDT